jgi:hypothetical protein
VTTDSRVGDVGGTCPLAGVNNHVILVGMFRLRWCFVVVVGIGGEDSPGPVLFDLSGTGAMAFRW